MKKILMAVLIMAGAATAKAQTGSILLYGNGDFWTKNNQGGSYLSVNPGIGYQVNNNWTFGIDMGVTHYEPAGGTDGTTGVKAGIFGRYSKPVSNIFSIYGQANVSYLNKQDIAGNILGDGNGFGVNLFPAVFINIKNNFGLNFDFGGIGFNSFKPKGSSTSSSTLALNFGKNMSIGISKNFGGKK